MTILKQLEQIGALGVGDRRRSETIDHQDIDPRELREQARVAAVEAREAKLFEQA